MSVSVCLYMEPLILKRLHRADACYYHYYYYYYNYYYYTRVHCEAHSHHGSGNNDR